MPTGSARQALRVTDAQVDWLEAAIDRLNDNLTPLTSFVLPGGTPAAAFLHQARTVVRRAERETIEAAPAGIGPAVPALPEPSLGFPVRDGAPRQRPRVAATCLWRPGANRGATA